MPRKIAIRFLSSGIVSLVFALIFFLRVILVGNSIPFGEFMTLLLVSHLALLDAVIQFFRLWIMGKALTPIDEIIRTDQKD